MCCRKILPPIVSRRAQAGVVCQCRHRQQESVLFLGKDSPCSCGRLSICATSPWLTKRRVQSHTDRDRGRDNDDYGMCVCVSFVVDCCCRRLGWTISLAEVGYLPVHANIATETRMTGRQQLVFDQAVRKQLCDSCLLLSGVHLVAVYVYYILPIIPDRILSHKTSIQIHLEVSIPPKTTDPITNRIFQYCLVAHTWIHTIFKGVLCIYGTKGLRVEFSITFIESHGIILGPSVSFDLNTDLITRCRCGCHWRRCHWCRCHWCRCHW